jgi:L-lactate dehydrogenase complex protein LldF
VQLQGALNKARGGFVDHRREAVDTVPEFDALRASATAVREHTLRYLDHYLCLFEEKVRLRGGQVHWARDAAEARDIVVELCRERGARAVTKSKSMVTEEIDLNCALEDAGFEVTETDLGEYIIQLAGERPSHIIAPAVHKSRGDIRELFEIHHGAWDSDRESVSGLVDEARQVLRDRFAAADVGITGANFLIAETGSVLIVSNEGNVDLTVDLPSHHIAVTGIEKVVPGLNDAMSLVRVLGRSASGQAMTTYCRLFTGAAEDGSLDIVLVDNGRSEILGGEQSDILRCIRCGACLNHCPVYMATGGHAYGWVYPGPMGAVLTPLLAGVGRYGGLADASTFCGRCEAVCPVSIPLPRLLRSIRDAGSGRGKVLLRLWAWLARHPRLYAIAASLGARVLHGLARGRGRLHRLAFAGAWTRVRDLPAPQGRTFRARWRQRTHAEHLDR